LYKKQSLVKDNINLNMNDDNVFGSLFSEYMSYSVPILETGRELHVPFATLVIKGLVDQP
jgi:hypothetical protein